MVFHPRICSFNIDILGERNRKKQTNKQKKKQNKRETNEYKDCNIGITHRFDVQGRENDVKFASFTSAAFDVNRRYLRARPLNIYRNSSVQCINSSWYIQVFVLIYLNPLVQNNRDCSLPNGIFRLPHFACCRVEITSLGQVRCAYVCKIHRHWTSPSKLWTFGRDEPVISPYSIHTNTSDEILSKLVLRIVQGIHQNFIILIEQKIALATFSQRTRSNCNLKG